MASAAAITDVDPIEESCNNRRPSHLQENCMPELAHSRLEGFSPPALYLRKNRHGLPSVNKSKRPGCRVTAFTHPERPKQSGLRTVADGFEISKLMLLPKPVRPLRATKGKDTSSIDAKFTQGQLQLVEGFLRKH